MSSVIDGKKDFIDQGKDVSWAICFTAMDECDKDHGKAGYLGGYFPAGSVSVTKAIW